MGKYIIIGQGIAGVAVAHTLMLRGHEVELIDDLQQPSATSLAAGILNPVTGKRYALSWRYPEFFAFAKAFYVELGQYLGQELWHDRTITRLFTENEDYANFLSRSGFAEYQAFLAPAPDAGSWHAHLKNQVAFGKLYSAGQVSLPLLQSAWRQKTLATAQLLEKRLSENEILALTAHADGVILTQGHSVSQQSLFGQIPWKHAKGTVGFVRLLCPESALPLDSEMLKGKIMLATTQEKGLYWAGANYEWAWPDDEPSSAGKDMVTTELQAMLSTPYKIESWKAGIRPVAADRRPVLGQIGHDKLFLFNGLGAKGTLLAPYWAAHLADHITLGTPLDPDVDMSRFGG